MSQQINKWDEHFLVTAILQAKMSKDPSTQVGAVIVTPDKEIVSTGFNGFPRGIKDLPERLNDRDLKLRFMVHAEMNAVLTAAKLGIKIGGCTMYLAAMNSNGDLWGGPPCHRCTAEILQTGISKIISYKKKQVPSKWAEDLVFAENMLKEAGIEYIEVDYNG